MITTKTEILALLKRNGGHSVREIAMALDLAPVTIRQHLTHLERDGLVVAERRLIANGRPASVFALTARGHIAAFPRRSDRLVELLVREVGRLEGHELAGLTVGQKTGLVLQRLARRLADEYAPLLHGWPLAERVAFVAEAMHADGGMAEWERTAQGFEIRDFNCFFHRLVEAEEQVCEWHLIFLSRLLGADVWVTPGSGENRCCRFIVEPVQARSSRTPEMLSTR